MKFTAIVLLPDDLRDDCSSVEEWTWCGHIEATYNEEADLAALEACYFEVEGVPEDTPRTLAFSQRVECYAIIAIFPGWQENIR